MYFPQFVVGMAMTLVVVTTWAYLASGSVWKAVVWGICTAVLLQVGYFILVARLIYARRVNEQGAETRPDSSKQQDVPSQPLPGNGR
ncbi:exopolysaccharide production repressor protein [Mesorhizobium sp. 128a]